MTTSWAYLMRGRPIESLNANVGGTILAILAGVFGPWAIASGVRGRWLGRALSPEIALVLVGVALGATLVDWSFRWFTST